MTFLNNYLQRIQKAPLQEVSQALISLGPGGWRTWKRFNLASKTALERCSMIEVPDDRNLCKYKVKFTEARRKVTFLRGINCRFSKDPDVCKQQVDDEVEDLTNSIRDYQTKITKLLRGD